MVSIVLSLLLLSSFSVRNQANSFSKWGILHSEARQWVPFTGHSVSSNRDHGDCQQSACETGTVQDLKANEGTDTCSISGPALCVGLPKSPGLLILLGGNAAGRAEACWTSSRPRGCQSFFSSRLTPAREAKGTSVYCWEISSWWSNSSGLQFQA